MARPYYGTNKLQMAVAAVMHRKSWEAVYGIFRLIT